MLSWRGSSRKARHRKATGGAQTPPPASPPLPRRKRRWLGRILALGACLFFFLGLFGAWLLGTESGFRNAALLAARLTHGRVLIEHPSGRLLDHFAFSRFLLISGGTQVEVHSAAVDWRLAGLLKRQLHVQRADIGSVRVRYTVKRGAPLLTLALPLVIQVDDVRLRQLAIEAQRAVGKPKRVFGLTDVRARAMLAHAVWRLDQATGTTDWGQAELAGTLETVAPFALDTKGRLRSRYASYVVQAQLRGTGSLTHMDVDYDAAAAGLAARGTVVVRALDPQPLGAFSVDAGVIDPRRFQPDAPSGALSVHARLEPALDTANVPRGARLGTRRIEGTVTVTNAQPGPFDAGKLPLERFSARVNWGEGAVRLTEVDALLSGGGKVQGQLDWQTGAADALGQLDGRMRISNVAPIRLHSALPHARVSGDLQARVDRETQWAEAHLTDARLSLDAVLKHRAGVLEVLSLRLGHGNAQVTGKGRVSLNAERRFAFDAQARSFDPNVFWGNSPTGSLSGRLAVSGQLAPQRVLAVRLDLEDSALAGMPLTGGGTLALSGTRIAQSSFALEVLGNRLSAQGAFGLPGDRLAVSLNAPKLDLLGFGLAGRLRARGELGGSAAQPAGTLDISASRVTLPGGLRMDALNFQGELNEGQDGRVDARFTLAGVRRTGKTEQLVRRAAVVATGTRRAHEVSVDVQALRGWRLAATARGGLSERLDWQGQLARLKLDWGAELVLASPATLAFGPSYFKLGAARLVGEHAVLLFDGLSWRPEETLFKGSLSGLRVGLALNESQQVVVQGESLQVGANWDIALGQHANGQIRVFREDGDFVLGGDSPVALGLTELELVLAASDDRLAASLSAAGKRIGVISASATAAAQRHGLQWQLAEAAPLLGSAHIKVPALGWVGPLLDPNLRTAGSVQGDFTLAGTPAEPVASGEIRGEELAMSLAEQGFRLQGGKLRLRFDADRLYLDELSFISPNRVKPDERRIDLAALTAAPGRASVNGEVALATGEGFFSLTADRLPVMQRPDRWLLISGTGHIDTTWDSMSVQAKVTAPAGYFGLAPKRAPQLDDDVVVRGRLARNERRFLISTDIDVTLGDAFYLKAFGVDTRLQGQVLLHARPGEPLRATGQIETVNGLYDAYGQRLSIDEGLITFQGPLDNPSLAVTAVRKGLAVEAGVAISGSAQRPKVRLVSQPNVPDAEKLSWMILGRPPGSGSEADSAFLVAAASALVGDTAGGVTDQIARALGIDQIALAQAESRGQGRAYTSQVAGSATGFSGSSASSVDTVGGQVVVLGKRITQSVYVSFEQSLTGSESIVRLTYALSRHISMILRAGTENALDFSYHVNFR